MLDSSVPGRVSTPYVGLTVRPENGHFVFVLDETDTHVSFIESLGLSHQTVPSRDFFKVYTISDFPLRQAAEHLLAESCLRPFQYEIVSALKKFVPAYLMPQHFVPRFDQSCNIYFHNGRLRGSVAIMSFFSITEQKHPENYDMATKKPAPAKAKEPEAKKTLVEKAKAALSKKPTAPVEKEAPTKRGTGVTAYLLEQVAKGTDPEKIVEAVREKFPASKAGMKEIAWARSKLKKEGKL